jgi:hypothetical protein
MCLARIINQIAMQVLIRAAINSKQVICAVFFSLDAGQRTVRYQTR